MDPHGAAEHGNDEDCEFDARKQPLVLFAPCPQIQDRSRSIQDRRKDKELHSCCEDQEYGVDQRHPGEDEIARAIWQYGEERLSRRIARQIKRAIEEDRLSTTLDLAEICRCAYPPARGAKGHRIDPATRTFQALRIHINDELGELERALAFVPDGFEPQGVVAVISFHSLEDRIVKNCFRDWQQQGLGRILKPAPITADESERGDNPRARSAKLRVFDWGKSPKDLGDDKYRSKKHRRGDEQQITSNQ